MCGIAGILTQSPVDLDGSIRHMIAALRHRGPDSSGVWTDSTSGISLGHSRLSIIDLSPLGAQPMISHSGRFVVVFNGEIYNFQSLAVELRRDGVPIEGTSDTAVLLAAIEYWGFEQSLQRFNGMFAFALWDRRDRILSLARDRLGKKPLYYGWAKHAFIFGSELKALRAFPGFEATIDREALSLQLRHNYIPFPSSIYRGIYKIPPGSFYSMSIADAQSRPIAFQPDVTNRGGATGPRRFWSLPAVSLDASAHIFEGPQSDLDNALEKLLRDAVRIRMIADVPLGAFLSGGIDSSLIVALMQQECAQRVKTFSIGFDEKDFNEADHAARVAQHLGTEHHELLVRSADALNVIPKLPYLYDEPFSDSSQIPTYLLSEYARQSVTVALSGDGGDECFCGYPRYTWAQRLEKLRYIFPWPVNRMIGSFIKSVSTANWDRVLGKRAVKFAGVGAEGRVGHRLHRLADFLQADNRAELYRVLISHWDTPGELVLGISGAKEMILDSPAWSHRGEYIRQMMLVDQMTYLPADILTKVDRASMGVSLEVRSPLLDYRIVEFSWRILTGMLLDERGGKAPLRRLLEKYVPRSLIDRPKMGFGVPIQKWLTGPLREWANDLLDPTRMKQQGYINHLLVQKRWQEFLSRRRPWDQHIWDVLMFQSWYENFHLSRELSSRVLNIQHAPLRSVR